MLRKQFFAASLIVCAFCFHNGVAAQSLDTPMTRLRPIGSPSAVDQYRPPANVTNSGSSRTDSSILIRETAYQAGGDGNGLNAYRNNPVRQAAMMQGIEAPNLPNSGFANPGMGDATGGGMALPPDMASPGVATPMPGTSLPSNSALPPGSTFAPAPVDPRTITSSGDLAPIAAPQMSGGFATIDNCNCVTAPSSYVAASANSGCVPVGYQGPVGYQPVSQVTTPGVVVPASYPPRRAGIPRGPLISFGQELNPVQVGQGIVGQPVAYVPGQRFRNWVRYFFP